MDTISRILIFSAEKHGISVRDSAIVYLCIRIYRIPIGRGWDGIISLTFGDLEMSDQGHP